MRGDPETVRKLEAERLRPAPELTRAQQIEADLRQVMAILARELPSFHYRSKIRGGK